jgi:asparagine synthase (glutamine-hydrolysing)
VCCEQKTKYTMCGIAGGIAFNKTGAAYLERTCAAVACLQQRGPDQSGIFQHENVTLGQARLSVIDVSEAASQPFTDSSGRYTIVYNGEIYNFRELRRELEGKGIAFRSHSDTEVLLYGYISGGMSFLSKVNGFFAFCLYDKEEMKLVLARDRMGIKPLLIYQDDDAVLFASELKALIQMGIPKIMEPSALFAYLQLNYIPAPASILKNVTKAEPGTITEVQGTQIQTHSFYKIPYNPGEIGINHDSYEQACKRIVELLDNSVQKRMISDVPLGAFLSGGLDSSIIVALASRHTKHLHTYSIGFSDAPFFDETRYAEEVAAAFGTRHSVFRLATGDLLDILPGVLDYTDEPFADSSALAMYLLSRETRKHVTVALSGDGADELYGGYLKYNAECRVRDPGAPEKLVRWGAPLWNLLPKSRNSAAGNRIRQFSRFADGARLSSAERYWRWASIADERQAGQLLRDPASGAGSYAALKAYYLRGLQAETTLNDVLFADMHLVLRNDMLVKTDMMSMANSLEVRVPFLDHEHVNYVFSLPWHYKAGKHARKQILRDAFRDVLPSSVLNRPKHGFEVPLLQWLRTELNPRIQDLLLDEEFIQEQGIFHFHALRRVVDQLHSNDPDDTVARIWGLLVFQHWWKKYLYSSNDKLCRGY